MKIALLGAECTGKTTLAQGLAQQLRQAGKPLTLVPEYLRQWCDVHGRTPRAQEQASIAQAQGALIAQASANAWLVCDTTPLMTAVYSHLYFSDDTLKATALRAQGQFDLTLLCAPDLPWQADGILRDGPALQARTDALLRLWLHEHGLPYRVVTGQGPQRLANALAAITASMGGVA